MQNFVPIWGVLLLEASSYATASYMHFDVNPVSVIKDVYLDQTPEAAIDENHNNLPASCTTQPLPPSFCNTFQARLCNIPECRCSVLEKEEGWNQFITELHQGQSLSIVHRHGTRIAFKPPTRSLPCGANLVPPQLSALIKKSPTLRQLFQFSSHSKCTASELTGHGALQLYRNGEFFREILPRAGFKKIIFHSTWYPRTMGSAVAFAAGLFGPKANPQNILPNVLLHKFSTTWPYGCQPVVARLEKAQKSSPLHKEYSRHRDEFMPKQVYHDTMKNLSQICHGTQAVVNAGEEGFVEKLVDGYGERYRLNTDVCSYDLSLVKQGKLLHDIFKKKPERRFTFYSLHDINIQDLYCLFFTDKKETKALLVSFAAFMVFTESSVYLFNDNKILFSSLSKPIFTKSAFDSSSNDHKCKNSLKEFVN